MNGDSRRQVSHIESWLGSLLERSSVDKCVVIAIISLALRFLNALVMQWAIDDPDFLSVVDGDVSARLSQSFWGMTLFWALAVAWGFAIRRRAPEEPIYVTMVLMAVALTSVGIAFLTGQYTTPALLIIVGFLVICYMAFPRRFYLPPAITIALTLVGMSALERLHVIPYAPLFRMHGYGLGPHPNGIAVFFAILIVVVAFVVIGSAFVFSVRGLRRREELLRDESRTDSLTGMANRRYFLDQAHRELARASRYRLPVSCLMLDLDRFKRVNDRFGHAAGDQVLIAVASRLTGLLRQQDFIARLGGEEFAMLLPHTDAEQAAVVAERCRQVVAGIDFIFNGVPHPVTTSVGVASLVGEELTTSELLKRADEALYQAKADGRNCVRFGDGERGEHE